MSAAPPPRRLTPPDRHRWWRRPPRRAATHAAATKTIHGVLGVLQDAGRFLLIRRAAHVRIGGVWCFPGGTIERGESDPAALVRELREELGIAAVPVERLMVMRKHGGRLVLHWWSARIIRGLPIGNPLEVSALRWLTAQQIRAMPVINIRLPAPAPAHAIIGSSAILDRLLMGANMAVR